MAGNLQIFLFGEFRLQFTEGGPNRSLPKPPTRKSQSLLAFLICRRGQAHARDRLVGMFWGDRPQRRARRSLSTALWHIRRCFGSDDPLQADNQRVQFSWPGSLWLDVEAFTAQITSAGTARLQTAVSLYQGDFLDGFYDEWILKERYRLQTQYLDALARLMRRYETAVQPQQALQTARTLLQHDPLREAAHRTAMRAYAQLGQRSKALAQYQTCRQAVAAALDTAPMSATTQLYEAILAGEVVPVPHAAPISPAAVTAVPPPPAPADAYTLPFVGRDDALASLHAQWQQVRAGEAHLTLVVGEAGIGKTRLVNTFAAQLQGRGILTLSGRCYEFERLLPYQPVAEALSPFLSTLSAADLQQVPEWMLRELARLTPTLLAARPDLQPAPVDAASQDQTRLFHAVAHFLLDLCSRQPLLLLLEDCHWATDSTLQLIHYLVRHLQHRPVLILCTFREEGIARHAPLRTLQRKLQEVGGGTTLPLARLGQEDVAQLLQEMIGAAETAVSLAPRLHAATEGNPFFLVETINALRETGRLTTPNAAGDKPAPLPQEQAIPLPDRIRESIRARARRLPEEAQAALGATAVLGREFDFEPLQMTWDREPGTVLAALDELLRHRLLREGQGANERDYLFTHHKIQEVLYQDLPAKKRQWLHARAVQAIEAYYGSERHHFAGEIAFHAEEALPMVPDLRKTAVHYLQQAGTQAAASYAHQEAVAYFTRALDLEPETAVCYALLQARERVYDVQGMRRQQEQDLKRLAQLADAAANQQWQTEVALRRARYADVTGDYAAAIAANRRAIELAQTDELRATGYVQWGRTLWQQGNYDDARPHLEAALRLAQPAQMTHLQARSLQILGLIAWNQSRYLQAEEYLARALDLFRQEGRQHEEADVLGNLGAVARYMGDYDTARTHMKQALHIFQQVGNLDKQATVSLNLGIIISEEGHEADAERYYDQALQISRQVKSKRLESYALNSLGTLLLAKGNLASAHHHFNQALQLFEEIGNKRGIGIAVYNRGFTADLQGRYEKALEDYEIALRLRRELNDRQGVAFAREGIGRVLWHQGLLATALTHSQEALEIYREIGHRSGETSALIELGRQAMHLGRWSDAGTYLTRSLALARETGRGQDLCRALRALTLWHVHQKDYVQGHDLITEAVTLATELHDRLLQAGALTVQGRLHLAQAAPAAATAVLQQALALRRETAQIHLTLDPLAGLARAAQAQQNQTLAREHASNLLELLNQSGSAGAAAPGFVYLTCYEILQAAQDPRATDILKAAFALLQTRTETLDDHQRHTFWQNVLSHHAIRQAHALIA